MSNKAIEKNRVQQIIKLHNQIEADLKRSLDSAIRIGQLLAEQKEKMNHGEFGPWIESHLPFTDRTARNYMLVFREKDRLKTENVSDLKSAYRLLAETKERDILAEAAKLHLQMKTVLPRLRREIEEVDSIEDAVRMRNEALEWGQKNAEMIIDLDAHIGNLNAQIENFEEPQFLEKITNCYANCVNRAHEENRCSWKAAFDVVILETRFPFNVLLNWHVRHFGIVDDDLIPNAITEQELELLAEAIGRIYEEVKARKQNQEK